MPRLPVIGCIYRSMQKGITMTNSQAYSLPGRILLKPTIEAITKVIADEFGVSVETIYKKSNKNESTFPRYMVYIIARKVLKWSYARIGFGFKQDHITVGHGIKTGFTIIETNKEYRWKFIQVCHKLGMTPAETNELIKVC